MKTKVPKSRNITPLLLVVVLLGLSPLSAGNAFAESEYEQCVRQCDDGGTTCIDNCRDLPGAGQEDPTATDYEQCIETCRPCSNGQIEYCRSLPGAGSGNVDDPVGSASGTGPVNSASGSRTIGIGNALSFDSIEELLDRIADILFTYSIPLLVIMIIIGAFYLLTAGGDPGKIKTGKDVIKWAIIGFVIILIAGSVASLIKNLLEV